MARDKVLTGFSDRLNEICDDLGIPAIGRQTALANLVKLSQNATRKWLTGEGLPTLSMCIELATRAQVSTEWLVTGRGAKRIAACAKNTATIAAEPGTQRHYHVAALVAAVEELTPEDAHSLLPIVHRIANSTPKSKAQPNSTNARINLPDDDDHTTAAAQ